MELYRLPKTDSIDKLLRALDSHTPSGRRLSYENEKAFTALLDLISDKELRDKLDNLSPQEKTALLSRLKTNIQDIKYQKDLLGYIAFALILISVFGRLGIDILRQFDYEAPPLVRLILNCLDEVSLIPASISDNLNIAPSFIAPGLAALAQILISIISSKYPDHKYKKSLATFVPVIPLLVLDYFINKSVSNNSLSYLISNFFSVGVEMSSIKIAEARAAAAVESDAASVESDAAPVAALAAAEAEEARAAKRVEAAAEARADAKAEARAEARAEAVISASERLNKNIKTNDSFFLNIDNFNHITTKKQVLENLDEAIAIQNLPESFKSELEKIKKDLNIYPYFRFNMYKKYLYNSTFNIKGNDFHINMIYFEKVIQALEESPEARAAAVDSSFPPLKAEKDCTKVISLDHLDKK